MRLLSRSLALAFLVPLALPAQGTNDSARIPEVRTAATAQRSVRPDLAILSVQLNADGESPAEAGRRLAARADGLRRALATLGIPRDSMVSRSQWYWWQGRIKIIASSRCVPRRVPQAGQPSCVMVYDTTYRANDAIEVRMHDLSRVGAAIDTVMGRGVTDISGLRFVATNVAGAQNEALREATSRAHTQAETIAAAGGMRLGRVVSLSSEPLPSSGYPGLMLSEVVVTDAARSGPGTEVTAPSIQVSVTVHGRWELVPSP